MKNPFYPFSVEVSGYTCLKSMDGIYYKRNIDYYRKFKKILLIFSSEFAVVCIIVIILSDGWIQTLFATLLGGSLSSIIWFISVIISDDMNYRISRLDNVISQIDGLISELCTFNHYFVEGMEIVPIEANNLCYRLCKLLQVISELSVINEIDCDDLKFKWINETNVDIQSFQDSLEQMISNISFVLGVYTEKQLSDFVIYNEKYLSGQLKGLKNVLLKRKCYILCGKAPIPQNKVQNRINKANLFNRIFNRNQKV